MNYKHYLAIGGSAILMLPSCRCVNNFKIAPEMTAGDLKALSAGTVKAPIEVAFKGYCPTKDELAKIHTTEDIQLDAYKKLAAGQISADAYNAIQSAGERLVNQLRGVATVTTKGDVGTGDAVATTDGKKKPDTGTTAAKPADPTKPKVTADLKITVAETIPTKSLALAQVEKINTQVVLPRNLLARKIVLPPAANQVVKEQSKAKNKREALDKAFADIDTFNKSVLSAPAQ